MRYIAACFILRIIYEMLVCVIINRKWVTNVTFCPCNNNKLLSVYWRRKMRSGSSFCISFEKVELIFLHHFLHPCNLWNKNQPVFFF